MKSTLYGINSRLDIVEEKIRHWEIQQYKLSKIKHKRKRLEKKMNRASLSRETIPNFVTRNWNLKRAGTPEMYLKK